MINLLCLLCSFCIQFAYVDVTPYNMLSNNQSGIGQQYIDELRARISSNYQGYYQSTFSWINDVPDDQMVVVYGDILWGSYQSVYEVLVPLEPYNQGSSSISCTSYTYTDDIVDSVNINFNNYIKFWIGGGDYVDNPYYGGAKTYTFGSEDSYRLVYCYKPIYCNEVLVVDVTDDVEVPDFPSLPGIGSMGSGGHSSGTSPFDELNQNGHSWHSISGSISSSGHSVNVGTSTPSYNFTDPTENLLGQIVNNTNDLIGHSSSIYGALQTINSNIIDGISALFNGISAINSNIGSAVFYDQEKCEEVWENSSTYTAYSSLNLAFVNLDDNYESFIDDYSSTEDIDELIIPIDLTVWGFESDYGDFQPFDQIYYMRFGFLDETKAIWQPLFLGLLYMCLFFSIYLDLPNIIRGATK